MEILKQGDIEKISYKKYFECRRCGAIWTAEKSEYKYSCQYNESEYYCSCPMKGCHGTGEEISKAEAMFKLDS